MTGDQQQARATLLLSNVFSDSRLREKETLIFPHWLISFEYVSTLVLSVRKRKDCVHEQVPTRFPFLKFRIWTFNQPGT